MMKSTLRYLVFFLFFFSFACKHQDNPSKIDLPYSDWSAGKVSFKIYHGHLPGQEGDPSTIMVMVTDSIYPCANFTIDAGMNIEQGNIIVTLQGVTLPGGICLTALGPASFTKELSLTTGTYSFSIHAARSSDTYELMVTDTSLVITPGDSSISKPSLTTAWKIPEKSFAFVGGTTVETAWMFSDFVDSLKTIPSLKEFIFPGTGFIPYPTRSSGHYVDNPSRYFLYTSESDFDSAGAMLTRFRQQVIADQQGIGFYLINWRNKQYLSWVIN